MASLSRLSEVPELLAWFRHGLEQQGRSEAEIARCEQELNAELEREREQRRKNERWAARSRPRKVVGLHPQLEWSGRRVGLP